MSEFKAPSLPVVKPDRPTPGPVATENIDPEKSEKIDEKLADVTIKEEETVKTESTNEESIDKKPILKSEENDAPNIPGKPKEPVQLKEPVKPKEPVPVVAYEAPPWEVVPTEKPVYSLQILKSGQIVSDISLNSTGDKSYLVIGRLASCDIQLEHPSISRYHAVLQYGTDPMQSRHGSASTCGWHIFDLASTHGTFRNKQRLPAKVYMRVHVGHVVKFGASTRLFVMQGPPDDQEQESKYTVTEIKARTQRRKMIADGIIDPDPEKDADLIAERKKKGKSSEDGDEGEGEHGASWGMSSKYGKESDDSNSEGEGNDGELINFEEMDSREAFYQDDPKKALMHFLEREGLDEEVDFEYVEKGSSFRHQWSCTIRIPVDQKLIVAEALSTGSKKEAQAQCALKACRMLDAAEVLRRNKGSRDTHTAKKVRQLKENDFYDSDEDEFYDRTGEMEAKREKRKQRLQEGPMTAAEKKAQTYDELCKDLAEVESERTDLERQLTSLGSSQPTSIKTSSENDADALDTFMQQVQRGAQLDAGDTQEVKVRKSQLRQQIVKLNKEIDRLTKLCKVAKPADLPSASAADKLKAMKSKIWIGSVKGGTSRRVMQTAVDPQPVTDADEAPSARSKSHEKFVEETEDDDDKADVDKSSKSDENPVDKSDPSTSTTDKTTIKQPSSKPTNMPSTSETETPVVKPMTKATSKRPLLTDDDEPDATVISPDMKKPIKSTDGKSSSSDQPGETTADNTEQPSAKRSRQRQRQRPNRAAANQKESSDPSDYDPTDPDFATWLPPTTQRGDGRTSLNDKYGY